MVTADEQSFFLDQALRLPPGEALELFRARGDVATGLLGACDEAEKIIIADLKRGLELAERLTAIADASGLAVPRARARRAHAQGLAYANRYADALTLLNEAIALAEGAGNAPEAARSRMTSLHALARQGRFTEAAAAGEAARAAFVEAGETALAARADANLGVVLRMSDDPARALEHFDRARPAMLDTPVALAQLDSNRAEAMLDLHRFADAERAFSDALRTFRDAGAARAAGIVEGNLADLASRRGDPDTALEHFERARRALGQSDAPADAARLEVEQAETLAALGLVAEAAERFREASPVLAAHRLAWEHARAQAGLGAALARLGRAAEAGAALESAAAEFEGLGHPSGAARVRVLQAELARRGGDAALARTLLDRAAPAVTDRPALAALASLQRAAVELSAGRHDAALDALEPGLADARRLGLAPLVADFLELRARARAEQGDHRGAVADLREAVDHVDRLRGTLRADRFRAAFLGGHAPLFERCVTAILDLGEPSSPAAAFEMCERGRSRSLLDTMQSSAAVSVPSGADEAERALLDEISRLHGEMNSLYAALDDGLSRPRTRTDHRRWSEDVADRERRTAALEARLHATSRVAPVFSRPRPLEACAGLLAPDEALVCYFAEGHQLSAFVVRHDSTGLVRRFCTSAAVGAAAGACEFQVGRAIARGLPEGAPGERLRADMVHELRALHGLLVAPLEGLLAGVDRVVFVPHAGLHAVPFSALWSASGPLVERFRVSLAPSATIWSRLAETPAPGADRPMLVVGVADELAPHAEAEARAVAESRRSTVLLGAAATVSAVREAMRGAGVVHVAAHARFSPGDPLNSGLKLADGWLTAREISGLRLDSAAVVLSGCDTGRLTVGGADEIWGLVRAFLAAGASSLVISLWPANDRITAETMASFHADWYSGQDGELGGPSDAMRRAQLGCAGRGMHPAGWANFVVIGKP